MGLSEVREKKVRRKGGEERRRRENRSNNSPGSQCKKFRATI